MTRLKNKIFIFVLGLATALVFLELAVNLRDIYTPVPSSVTQPEASPMAADIDKIKQAISKSGIAPHPAKYWQGE